MNEIDVSTYEVTDDFFGAPWIDWDKDVDDPEHHRQVHGGFEGTVMPMQPAVDGAVRPGRPLDPVGSPRGVGVAVLVGSAQDDMKMMMLGMPWFGVLDEAD